MSIVKDHRRLSPAGAALGCLLLTACAGQTATTATWVKTGADDQTVARELADCNAQANAALATEQGVNADINATLGRNWQWTAPCGQAPLTNWVGRRCGRSRSLCNSCWRRSSASGC